MLDTPERLQLVRHRGRHRFHWLSRSFHLRDQPLHGLAGFSGRLFAQSVKDFLESADVSACLFEMLGERLTKLRGRRRRGHSCRRADFLRCAGPAVR